MPYVHLDGQLVPRERAAISVDDRGFLFGDGVYEVIRAVNGELVAADRHFRRLHRSLSGIDLALPAGLDESQLADTARRLLAENELRRGEALIYLQITRGAAPRTHHFPPPGTKPTVYMGATPFAPPHALRRRGARAITLADLRWARCDLKTVNLLPNTLAKQRAAEQGADEAMMVRDGVVTEGSSANFFAVVDGTVRTHPADHHILPGITREVVLEVAAELGLPLRELAFRPEDIARASEIFFTSTTNDVMPVVDVDGRAVGDGEPGPVARQLYDAVAARLGVLPPD